MNSVYDLLEDELVVERELRLRLNVVLMFSGELDSLVLNLPSKLLALGEVVEEWDLHRPLNWLDDAGGRTWCCICRMSLADLDALGNLNIAGSGSKPVSRQWCDFK